MAKKKAKAKKVQHHAEPKKKPQKSSSAGWIIGVIIVVVIIIAIILLLRGTPKEAEQPVVTEPTATPTTSEKPIGTEGPEIVSNVPEEVKYCKEEYAIGYPKNKIGDPCLYSGSQATVELTYSGKGDSLSGMWFKVTTVDGTVTYLKDARSVKQGDTVKYVIPDVGDKIDTMLALPMITEGGQDKACLNQRLIVIKSTNCMMG